MRKRIWVLLLLLFFGAGCPVVEGPEEQGSISDGDSAGGDEAGDDQSGDREGDLGGDGDGEGREAPEDLTVWSLAHRAIPPGWEGADVGESFVFDEDGRVEIGLDAGIYGFSEAADGEIGPLGGTFTISELEGLVFLVPEREQIRLRALSADEVEILRIAGSKGEAIDQALGEDVSDVEVLLELLSALREPGGLPSGSESLHFFVGIGSEDGIDPQLRGTFNDWQAREADSLKPLAGRLWGRFVEGIQGYHQYKLVYGDGAAWFTDFANPDIRWDGIDTGGLGAFNSVIHPEEGEAREGRLVWWPRVQSEIMGDVREVYIYLPRSYDQSTKDYPLLIVHDGNESISRGRFHQVADQFEEELIIAFVALSSQQGRIDEYTIGTPGSRGELYGAFLVEELLPTLEAGFRVAPQRELRGLAGASLGGLISFWIGQEYPDVFGFVGGMSSSFFWGEGYMKGVVETRGCQDLRYYLDSGSPADNYVVTLEMRELLEELECEYVHQVQEGGVHDWSFWNDRFPDLLATFL